MTRLRFRAWLMNDREMVFMDQPEYRSQWSFYFVEANDHHPYGVGISHYQGEVESNDSWRPDEIALMQSTGLKDKDFKEIYEGDIFQWSFTTDIYKGEVSWWPERAGFGLPSMIADGRSGFMLLDARVAREGLVIGNIYENPELVA